MILRFPELMGGPVQGLNDAGVENFQGAIDLYVSRECGQNTGDAVRNGIATASLEFDRLMIKAEDIPAFASLRETLQSCLDRWKGKDKEREFFETAVALASHAEIPVLKISDYGTTGLTGEDTDETGRWFALVKSQGVSNKDNTAGGSFGIGKSSPFAASRFRTVFYGTRTEAGAVALQGVCRLVTHLNQRAVETQGIGFIGKYDENGGIGGGPVFRSIRNPAEIPAPFRRDEPGTGIWVIGYRSGDMWANDLIRSLLTNFWPAIQRGSIAFRVGDKAINKDSLAGLIDKFIGSEEFEAHHYFEAIKSKPIRKRLKHVGECDLYLTTISADLPKKICMSRHSGMRIFDYSPRACRVPFSGLFICTDNNGNALLRKLEPPKHDAWDHRRLEDNTGKRALDEIKGWIREEVKKLNPLFGGKSFDENELAKYLPDNPDEETEELQGDTGASDAEKGLEPQPKGSERPPLPLKVKRHQVAEAGTGEGYGKNNETGGGLHGNGGGGDGPGRGGGGSSDDNPPIHARSYRSGPDAYQLILRSNVSFSGKVRVRAVGEDGTMEAVALTAASDGKNPLQVHEDCIAGVRLEPAIPLRLSVTLKAPNRRSLFVLSEQ